MWSPFVVIGTVGLFFFKGRTRWAFLVVLLLGVFVCSLVSDWWGGSSFGMRRLNGMVPVIAVGYAALFDRCRSDRSRLILRVLTFSTVAWNMLFAVQFGLNLIPRGNALSFDQLVTQKLLLPVIVIHRFL